MDLHNSRARLSALALGALLTACGALADRPKPELPARDLTVELRQVEEGLASGYTVSTSQSQSDAWPAQGLRVRNGEKAMLRIAQSMPVQWVQSVAAQSTSVATPGVRSQSSGAAVQQGVTWMQSGQTLVLTPRWPGGQEDVTVQVELETASMGAPNQGGLPAQNQRQLATTVTAPLGYWVIIASSGGTAAAKGVYSSSPGNEVRRTVQVRVTAP